VAAARQWLAEREADRVWAITLDAAEFIRRFLVLWAIVSNADRIRIDLRQRQGAPLDRKLDEHQWAPHEFALEMTNSVPRER
jgi:hypothetical protein